MFGYHQIHALVAVIDWNLCADLQRKCRGDDQRAMAEFADQSVIVTAAIAEAVALRRERDAGYQNEVDFAKIGERAFDAWLAYAECARGSFVRGIGHAVNFENIVIAVDTRQI